MLFTVEARSGWLYATWRIALSGTFVLPGNGFTACTVAVVLASEPDEVVNDPEKLDRELP